MNTNKSITYAETDPVRVEVIAQLQQVIDDGSLEGNDLHFFATHLLIEKKYRDVFASLKTKEGRNAWLRRAFEMELKKST
jgi:hypothetical protein